MDWIDEQLEKLMRRLERTDLKWSLILYIGIAVVSALLAAILTAQSLQQLDGSSDDALLSGRGDQRIRSGRKSSVFPRGDGLP